MTYCLSLKPNTIFLWDSIYTLLGKITNVHVCIKSCLSWCQTFNSFFFWPICLLSSVVQISFSLWIPIIPLPLVPNYTILSLLPNPSVLSTLIISLHHSIIYPLFAIHYLHSISSTNIHPMWYTFSLSQIRSSFELHTYFWTNNQCMHLIQEMCVLYRRTLSFMFL